MKIRTKLALRYAGTTAVLMLLFAMVIYIMSSLDRDDKFYDDLYKEGVSKASLFLETKVTPDVMQSIYRNNIEYIDEVEVAIYSLDDHLLYHDAKDVDIIKETPELLNRIKQSAVGVNFSEGRYQAVGFLFLYKGNSYVVTAAAYDGYGYAKLLSLAINLLLLTLFSVVISYIIGYYLAKRALKPVAEISDKMDEITAGNISLRLLKYTNKDEFSELAASFNRALDIIESSFESQKMFVSNVSHELRTPLAVVIGEIDLALLKKRTAEEYKETLINAKSDAGRMIQLLNGLLDLAKASYDESKISMTNIRIDEVLLDARESVLKGHSNYNINLQFNLEAEDLEKLQIRGNEYLLKTAFANLLDNNCKFSNDHLSTVHISFDNDHIVLCFSDTGVGIPAEDLEHIFVPFYRGSNKTYTTGNGIGMTLVKRVVLLHKGTISVDSEVGKGTLFKIIL